MFYKWRINRLRREIHILAAEVGLLRIAESSYEVSHYTDRLIEAELKLEAMRFDLGILEGKE